MLSQTSGAHPTLCDTTRLAKATARKNPITQIAPCALYPPPRFSREVRGVVAKELSGSTFGDLVSQTVRRPLGGRFTVCVERGEALQENQSGVIGGDLQMRPFAQLARSVI